MYVKLKRPAVHFGRGENIGDIIEVDRAIAEKMIEQEVAEECDAPKKSKDVAENK